jgi:hypothetical protein
VFEKRVLRRIFGLRRDEVMGEWRKLYNEEFRDLYSSPTFRIFFGIRFIINIFLSSRFDD